MTRVLFIVMSWFFSSFFSHSTWAFPEMVRHNYVNCTACHVSPTGGGVLTQYGRELSRALLSTWGEDNENESKFAYGLVRPPSWLDATYLYRGLYAYQDTPYIQQGLFIYMQGDAEAAAHVGQWTFDLALGYQNPPGASGFSDYLISPRNYVNYRPTDEFSVRGGRFYPAYGIYTAEHVIPIKRDLGWDQGMETYNLEAAWLGDSLNVYVTADLGRPDEPSLSSETGFVLTPSLVFGDHYKIGASYFRGQGPVSDRDVFGPWGILGFTPHFFLLTELDAQHQWNKTSGATQWGAVNYQRLDYELITGLHFYLTQDFSNLNFSDPTTLHNSFGAGVQFFPRPHFEINVSWSKLRDLSVASGYSDFAWAMLNFYL